MSKVIAKDDLKPAKLGRRLKIVYENYCDKHTNTSKNIKLEPSGTGYGTPEKTLAVSFEISKLKPYMLKTVEELLG